MNNGQGFFQSHAYIQNTVQRISRYDNFTSSDVEKCQDETSSVTNTSPSNSKTIPYSSKSSSGIDPHERMVITVTEKPSSERKSKENSIKFPSKLMYVLECGEYDDIVCWSSDGQSFIIKDCKAFESIILPEIFKQAKFSSFLRKLYRWGFVKSCKDEASFTHTLFCPGNYSLCMMMSCSKKANHSKPNQAKCVRSKDEFMDDSYTDAFPKEDSYDMNLKYSTGYRFQNFQRIYSLEQLAEVKTESSSYSYDKYKHFLETNRSMCSLHELVDFDIDSDCINQPSIEDVNIPRESSTYSPNNGSISVSAVGVQETDSFLKNGSELPSIRDISSCKQGNTILYQCPYDEYLHIFDSVFRAHLISEGHEN